MRPEQRLCAYGVCRTDRDGGGVVLVRLSPRSDLAGTWLLPGGGVDHGEDPADAVVREFREETGLDVEVTGLRDVLDDVRDLPHRAARVHTIRVIFDVRLVSGDLRPEVDGSCDRVEVVGPGDADDRPLLPFTARALGLLHPDPQQSSPPAPGRPVTSPDGQANGQADGQVDGQPDGRAAPTDPPPGRVRRQRTGAYALVAQDGHVLLTRLSALTPDPGRWTLPGGGIDHGEQVRDALVREVREESGLHLENARPAAVMSRRFHGRSPAGVAEDFHAVQLVFTGTVAAVAGARPHPRVIEAAGTTDAVEWVSLDRVPEVRTTAFATRAIELLRRTTATA